MHLSATLRIGAVFLLLPACRLDSPASDPQGSTTAMNRRAIVPLVVTGDRLAICRLDTKQPLPAWANIPAGEFFSATRTPDELSIIVADTRVPRNVKCERDWRLLKVKGPLDFNQVGIISGLSGALADAGVSIFALSTYDTDYVMVKQGDFDRAVAALRQAGYPITQP
jgi:uncharacterized protein